MNEEKARSTDGARHARQPTVTSPGTPRRVMVCLDGSPLSEACVPYAGFMASVLGAELTLLQVIPSPTEGMTVGVDVLNWEISRREAEQYLARVRGDIEASGVAPARIHIELTQGQPAERVLAIERENGVFLTLLSRRGLGAAPAGDLGATAERVLANACGSVLIIPSGGLPPVVPPRRIMVPLDGSTRAESVLPFVLEAAAGSHAEIVLVHVVTEPRASGILRSEENLLLANALATHLQEAAQAYLVGLRENSLRASPCVQVHVLRRVDTREALLELAREESIDLIVQSAHGATCNASQPFGSVTAHALAHAALPLLVVQDLSRDGPRWDSPATSNDCPEGRSSIPSHRGPS